MNLFDFTRAVQEIVGPSAFVVMSSPTYNEFNITVKWAENDKIASASFNYERDFLDSDANPMTVQYSIFQSILDNLKFRNSK